MRYLKRLVTSLLAGIRNKSSSPELSSESVLARAVYSKSHYWKDPLRPKHMVFEPVFSASTSRFEMSAYCIDNLSDAEKWKLLIARTSTGRNSSLKAAAEVELRILDLIEPSALTCDANWQPERHVNVIGWESSREGKLSQQQSLAVQCSGFNLYTVIILDTHDLRLRG